MNPGSPRPRIVSDSTGYTLAELLVAMAVGSLVVGSAVMLTGQIQKSYGSQLDGAAVQQEARYAMDWITRALQSAGSNPSSLNVAECPAAGTTFRAIRRDPNADAVNNDVRIHADINPPNGLLGGLAGGCVEAGEDVTIAHDVANRTITRRDNNVGAAAVPMSDTVITQLLFQYFRASGAAATTDDGVATVRVTITARTPAIDAYTGQPVNFTITSDVRMRAR
ncbi:MAG: prepilin-type N-terminal cleavage/methylation domain-containing protein [Vicinamibacterales bacterium]